MCFSAEASYTAAALLLPAGALASQRAYQANRKYLAIAALPLLFGFQQFCLTNCSRSIVASWRAAATSVKKSSLVGR